MGRILESNASSAKIFHLSLEFSIYLRRDGNFPFMKSFSCWRCEQRCLAIMSSLRASCNWYFIPPKSFSTSLSLFVRVSSSRFSRATSSLRSFSEVVCDMKLNWVRIVRQSDLPFLTDLSSEMRLACSPDRSILDFVRAILSRSAMTAVGVVYWIFALHYMLQLSWCCRRTLLLQQVSISYISGIMAQPILATWDWRYIRSCQLCDRSVEL